METTISSGNMQSFLRLLDDKGMTPERFTAILASGILADVCDASAQLNDRDAIRSALKLGMMMPGVFRLTVDYGKTLEGMIAAGHYDWRNNDITAKRFPISGSGIVEFEARYFHFNRDISSENAVKEIEQADRENPWMPAKIEHILAHGAMFPEEQRKYPVVGLGSVAEFGGHRLVPYLCEVVSERYFHLSWWVVVWLPSSLFLAVRKVSAS